MSFEVLLVQHVDSLKSSFGVSVGWISFRKVFPQWLVYLDPLRGVKLLPPRSAFWWFFGVQISEPLEDSGLIIGLNMAPDDAPGATGGAELLR